MRTHSKSFIIFGIVVLSFWIWSCDRREPERIVSLVINEFMAVNDSVLTDEYGDFDDWIELYNTAEDTIFLSGYSLTDNYDLPEKYTFADTAYIVPYGYMLLWADNEPTEGRLHTSFKLSGEGERIGLFDDLGTRIDFIEFPMQSPDMSYGRYPNGSDTLMYFGLCEDCITLDCETNCSGINPTPGGSNDGFIFR